MDESGSQLERGPDEYNQVALDQSMDSVQRRLGTFFRMLSTGSAFDESPLRHLAIELEELSKELKAVQVNLAYYAEEGSRELAEFLDSETYSALFVKRELATRTTYLNGHLGRHIDTIFIQGLTQKRYGTVFSGMRELYRAISSLRLLKDNWTEFRKALAKGLENIETGERMLKAFDELSHSITREINADGQKLIWSQWAGALSDLRLTEQLAEWLRGLFENVGWSFDTICSMSASVMPLATLLGTKMKVKWILCDNRTLNFHREPQKNERILLLDTAIETGTHYYMVARKVEAATEIPVVGCFCLVHNDMLPPDKAKQAMKVEEIPNLIYLYEMSELFEVWEQRSSPPDNDPQQREEEAFIRMRDILKEKYLGQYVAVHGGNVVDTDVDESRLIERFYRKFGASPVYIDIVADSKPIIEMPSPYSLTEEG